MGCVFSPFQKLELKIVCVYLERNYLSPIKYITKLNLDKIIIATNNDAKMVLEMRRSKIYRKLNRYIDSRNLVALPQKKILIFFTRENGDKLIKECIV